MADHHKAGRYVLQHFGSIFAKLLQSLHTGMIVSEPVKVPTRGIADQREKLHPSNEPSRVNRFGRSPIAPPHCLTIVVLLWNTVSRLHRWFDNANNRHDASLSTSLPHLIRIET
jgi:hypothetical protein